MNKFYVSGDTFNTSVVKTWEFTAEKPLRSIVLPKLLFSPAFLLLRQMSSYTPLEITGYTVLLASRLVILALSCWIDWCLYQLCRLTGTPHKTAAILFAGSYVTLTFQCHSFSNSLETVMLMTAFLIVVKLVRSKYRYDKILESKFTHSLMMNQQKHADQSNKEYLQMLHSSAYSSMRKRGNSVNEPTAEDLIDECFNSDNEEMYDSQSELEKKFHQECYLWAFLFSVVTVLGVFNRPTFGLYGFMMFFWWNDVFNTEKHYFKVITVKIVTAAVTCLALIIFDLVYFCEDTSLLFENPFIIVNFITPLNFILYNSASENLSGHGRHPFYVHLVVNMPLLLGPILVPLWRHHLMKVTRYFCTTEKGLHVSTANEVATKDCKNSDPRKERRRLINGNSKQFVERKIQKVLQHNMMLFIYFPVIVLSLFPHQEARFLIPVVPLAVFTSALYLKPTESFGKLFWTCFVIFNSLLAIVFGLLHQAGVVPCLFKLQHLHTQHGLSNSVSVSNIVFSHTYMPPKHLLCDYTGSINLVDMKGQPLQEVCSFIQNFDQSSRCSDKKCSPGGSTRPTTFIVLPGTLVKEFQAVCSVCKHLQTVDTFFPHVSFEDPPEIGTLKNIKDLVDKASLHLLKINV